METLVNGWEVILRLPFIIAFLEPATEAID